MNKKPDESDKILEMEFLTDKAIYCAEKKDLHNVIRYLNKRRAVLESIKDFQCLSSDIDSTATGLRKLLSKDDQLKNVLHKTKSKTEKQMLQFGEMKKLRMRFSGKPARKSRFLNQLV